MQNTAVLICAEPVFAPGREWSAARETNTNMGSVVNVGGVGSVRIGKHRKRSWMSWMVVQEHRMESTLRKHTRNVQYARKKYI